MEPLTTSQTWSLYLRPAHHLPEPSGFFLAVLKQAYTFPSQGPIATPCAKYTFHLFIHLVLLHFIQVLEKFLLHHNQSILLNIASLYLAFLSYLTFVTVYFIFTYSLYFSRINSMRAKTSLLYSSFFICHFILLKPIFQ